MKTNILDEMRDDGKAFIYGFREYLELLSPVNNSDVWSMFGESAFEMLLNSCPKIEEKFFLNDESEIDNNAQKAISFLQREEKSHLTVFEGIGWAPQYRWFPQKVQKYLCDMQKFITFTREFFEHSLPPTEFPTTLKARVFRYQSSDPLVNFRPPAQQKLSMRPHIDGSCFTLVLANDDRRLVCVRNGNAEPVVDRPGKPFSVLLPGVAAQHDFGIAPTPHFVLPSEDIRVSVTVFFTPDLGGSYSKALEVKNKWRLHSGISGMAA